MTTSRASGAAILLLTGASNMIYELCLAQMTSSFFGGTLYHYTLMIGLFILSMGIGTLYAEKVKPENQTQVIIRVEIFLAGLAVLMPFYLVYGENVLPHWLFQVLIFTTNCSLGLLSGAELPLFRHYFARSEKLENILFFDYLGMFAGSLLFAVFLFPVLGIFSSIWVSGLINLTVLFYFYIRHATTVRPLYGLSGAVLLIACLAFLVHADWLTRLLQEAYVG